MTLQRTLRSSSFAGLLPLLLLSLSGCGEDFAEFTGVEPDGVAAGQSAGGSASQAGSGSSAPTSTETGATGGTGATGATGGTEPAATAGSSPSSSGSGGDLQGAGGDDSAGGEPPVGVTGVGGAAPQPTMKLDLIDDLEGSFPTLPLRDGRNGGWFSVHDDTYGQAAPVSVVVSDRESSHFTASFAGGGFTNWGAQMGVSLKSPSTGYDASKHCGVRFLVKGSGAGWSLLISDRLSVPQGGVCDAINWSSDQACYQFVGKKLAVSNVWQEVVVRFDELRLVSDPESPRRLETNAIYDIVFNFYDAAGAGFDLKLDDLSFIEKGSLACQ